MVKISAVQEILALKYALSEFGILNLILIFLYISEILEAFFILKNQLNLCVNEKK